MKVETREGSKERLVLTSLITDSVVLGRVASRWDGELFSSKWANIIASWCINYHRSYGEAPRRAIVALFSSWTETHQDRETVTLIDRFLSGLSEEWESTPSMPSQSLLDLAGSHFRRVRLARLRDALEGDLEANLTVEAEGRVEGYRRVELGTGSRINLFAEPGELDCLFAQDEEPPLVEYPGDLGVFWGRTLDRDNFVAIQAPEKSGKSFLLQDIAYRAMTQRRRVAYFEAGDMSKEQVLRRFITRAAKHPVRNPTGKWPYTVKWPSKINTTTDGEAPEVEFTEITFDEPLSQKQAMRACEKVMKVHVKSKKPYLSMSVHPNSSLSVPDINSILQSWSLDDGWHPDVVVVDYADILASPAGAKDEQQGIDATWRSLRRLSQELHCLVVTATQADAASYNKTTQDMSNFSRDKRKNAHPSAIVAINCTPAEREIGVYRLNYTARREGEAASRRCVTVAGCLALSSPCVRSSF